MKARIRNGMGNMVNVDYRAVQIVELPPFQKGMEPEKYIVLLPKNNGKKDETVHAHMASFYEGDLWELVQQMVKSDDIEFIGKAGFNKWFQTTYQWLLLPGSHAYEKWVEEDPKPTTISAEEHCWMTGDYSDECCCELCAYNSECSGYNEPS